MFIINSQSSISIANVINNWLDYMKSVTIFNFDKINLFADISFRFPYSSDMFLLEYRRQLVLYSFISINKNCTFRIYFWYFLINSLHLHPFHLN